MLLKKLTEINALPNNEGELRDFIKQELEGYVDSFLIDNMGNLIVEKNKDASGEKIAISAHMDEVGLIVNWIEESGLIRFAVWGCDARILPAKHVHIGKNKVNGVIGTKPIHLAKAVELTKAVPIENLYIDIGANNREEALKHVSIGDYVAFASEYKEIGKDKLKAKAFDDRVGCALAIEVLKSDTKRNITAVFCVQEEVGLRGSVVAAYRINPDIVINLECTTAADLAGVDDHLKVSSLGKGVVISLVDGTSVYLKKYIDEAVSICEREKIPYQFKTIKSGGTDAARYHESKAGNPVLGLALASRYLHSPVSMIDKNDYKNALKLLKLYIEEFSKN